MSVQIGILFRFFINNMDPPTKLMVLVPGFGAPFFEHKLQILKNNLDIIEAEGLDYKCKVCCYDDHENAAFPANIVMNPNVTVTFEKGIVGEFINRHARFEKLIIDKFTHFLIILDDIELQPGASIKHMIEVAKTHKMDILSPCMTEDSKHSYDYMIEGVNFPKDQNLLIPTRILELFCYLMPLHILNIYTPCLRGDLNPWTWGMDLLVREQFGLNVGFLSHIKMKHWYDRTCYDKFPQHNAPLTARRFLGEYGFSLEELQQKSPYMTPE